MSDKQKMAVDVIWMIFIIILLVLIEFGITALLSNSFENKWVMTICGFLSGISIGWIITFAWERMGD